MVACGACGIVNTFGIPGICWRVAGREPGIVRVRTSLHKVQGIVFGKQLKREKSAGKNAVGRFINAQIANETMIVRKQFYLCEQQPCDAPNTTAGEIPCHKSYTHRVYSLKREKR